MANLITMARTRKQPEERKAELVETARSVFRKKGYAETSVSDITREADVSSGLFYLYFKDKEEVFDAVAESIVLEGYTIIKAILEQGGLTALEKLKQAMRYLLASEAEERWTDELAARRLRHMRDRVVGIAIELYVPLVNNIIKQGLEERSFHVPYPPAAAAYFVQISLMHFDMLKGSEDMSAEDWWKAYLDFTTRTFGLEVQLEI